MKDTKRCTKCQATKVWRVERVGIQNPERSSGITNVPLGAIGRTAPLQPGDRFAQAYDGGHVDAYVCATCGYTELHWQGFERLRHHPPSGVHLLTAEAEGPYR